MHYLYIIYSQNIDRYYVGETSNVADRLILHNSHHYSKSFTKSASDWKIKLEFECLLKSDALYLERFVKRMKSKKFNKKVINNPLILKDILEKR